MGGMYNLGTGSDATIFYPKLNLSNIVNDFRLALEAAIKLALKILVLDAARNP